MKSICFYAYCHLWGCWSHIVANWITDKYASLLFEFLEYFEKSNIFA